MVGATDSLLKVGGRRHSLRCGLGGRRHRSLLQWQLAARRQSLRTVVAVTAEGSSPEQQPIAAASYKESCDLDLIQGGVSLGERYETE